MRFPKTLTFLTLATVLVYAPPAWAQQKCVGPSGAGPWPNARRRHSGFGAPLAVRAYVACAAVALTLAGAQQNNVALGPQFGPAAFPSAHAALEGGGAVASVSDRRTAVGTPPLQKAERRLALQSAALQGGATTATGTRPGIAGSPAKPFTQEQVVSMVRDGFGDESGAKLIEQRGIDFAPSEDFMQTLKAAGASEAFLNALRAAVAPGLSPARNVAPTFRSAHADLKVSATTASSEPASAKKPLNQVQVFALLAGQVPSHRVAMLVQERGIDFEPTDDYLQEVRLAGGEYELISALKGAKVTMPATIDPAVQARQTEIRRHVSHGAYLMDKGRPEEAEQEYRAAIRLDPQNADLWGNLSYALGIQLKRDEAVSAAREAVRLDPSNEAAHVYLGIALRENAPCGPGGVSRLIEDAYKGVDVSDLIIRDCCEADFTESISQFREAISLNPDDEWAHYQLGETLDNRDAKFAEYSEALRLNPNYPHAHFALGQTLGSKGDLDGAIIEARTAIRLDPKAALFHEGLAQWLEEKGDTEQALTEYREAAKLFPLGYERTYEAFVQKVNATRQEEKLQHWLGTWVFAGPVNVSFGCGGKTRSIDVHEPDYTIKIITVSTIGKVTARVEHPALADESTEGITGADWSGTATENTLTLTMDPVPAGSELLAGRTLKAAAGRLEARREGDHYSVDFGYINWWTSRPKEGCSPGESEQEKRFLGQMRRP